MRVTRALEQPADKAEVFTDASGKATPVPVLDNTGVTGKYISSEGKKGDAVWSTRAKWTLLGGTIEGEPVTLAILDHPSNVGYPTHWHARGYGLFAANPLGDKQFNEPKDFNFTLEPGKSVTFKYRVLILGGAATPDRIERESKAFAQDGHRASRGVMPTAARPTTREKLERVARVAQAAGVQGVLLAGHHNIAWLTSGRANRIDAQPRDRHGAAARRRRRPPLRPRQRHRDAAAPRRGARRPRLRADRVSRGPRIRIRRAPCARRAACSATAPRSAPTGRCPETTVVEAGAVARARAAHRRRHRALSRARPRGGADARQRVPRAHARRRRARHRARDHGRRRSACARARSSRSSARTSGCATTAIPSRPPRRGSPS